MRKIILYAFGAYLIVGAIVFAVVVMMKHQPKKMNSEEAAALQLQEEVCHRRLKDFKVAFLPSDYKNLRTHKKGSLFSIMKEDGNTDEIFRVIQEMNLHIDALTFSDMVIDDHLIEDIIRVSPNELRFGDCSFTGDAKHLFSSLTKLRDIHFGGQCHWEPNFLESIPKDQLEGISFAGDISLTPLDMRIVSTFQRLQCIRFDRLHLEDNLLEEIIPIKCLEKIEFYEVDISGDALEQLSRLEYIKTLSIVGCNISDPDFSWLGDYPRTITLAMDLGTNRQLPESQAKLLEELEQQGKIVSGRFGSVDVESDPK